MEVIYAVENVATHALHQNMLQEATFILRREEERTFPNFQTWNYLGHLFVYAHDQLSDHTEWIRAESNDEFLWNGVYVNALPPPNDLPLQPPITGVQYDNLGFAMGNSVTSTQEGGGPVVGDLTIPWKEEVAEEEEEEEGPEEDQNWEQENEANERNPNEGLWNQEENNPYGDIRRSEERQAHLTHQAVEVDPTPLFPPVRNEGFGGNANLWKDVYPIGEEPQEPDQQDPTVNIMADQDMSPSTTFEEHPQRTRATKGIRRRSNYFRQFMSRRHRGTTSRNPGDAPTP